MAPFNPWCFFCQSLFFFDTFFLPIPFNPWCNRPKVRRNTLILKLQITYLFSFTNGSQSNYRCLTISILHTNAGNEWETNEVILFSIHNVNIVLQSNRVSHWRNPLTTRRILVEIECMQATLVNKIKLEMLRLNTSSLLNAFALGQQEWFMQLCNGKNAVPKI